MSRFVPLLLLGACGSSDPIGDDTSTTGGSSTTETTTETTSTAPPTYAAAIEPLLQTKCGGCHMNGEVSGFLDMDPGVAALVDVPSHQLPTMDLVEPGDPDASYLFLKVTNAHVAAGGEGDSMPTQFDLKAKEIGLLEEWILLGAPE